MEVGENVSMDTMQRASQMIFIQYSTKMTIFLLRR